MEACSFLKYAEDHQLYELFYTTLFFGLRRSEVLGLKWDAINFTKKELRVKHTVTKGTGVNRLNTTKTKASTRTFPLNDDQIKMFLYLQEMENHNRVLFGSSYQENDFVFKQANGSEYYPDYPTKAFKKIILRHTDLPQDITFHGLRSSCVSILVHMGYDVKSIQKWAGHEDINTTLMIYAKAKDKEAKSEILKGMDELIKPKKYDQAVFTTINTDQKSEQ